MSDLLLMYMYDLYGLEPQGHSQQGRTRCTIHPSALTHDPVRRPTRAVPRADAR